ncbi:hypothetical protein UK12_33140, partial [Saccharothrix sp. ST-888]
MRAEVGSGGASDGAVVGGEKRDAGKGDDKEREKEGGMAGRGADEYRGTLNRKLSIRGVAAAWGRRRGSPRGSRMAGLCTPARPEHTVPPLGRDELRALFALRAPLREQVTWHLLHETGGTVEDILA